MMKLTSKGALMAIAVGALVLSSCADEKDYYDENYKKELYASNWEKQFGKIDPNQDWNTASTNSVQVSIGYSGTYGVKIYTANPVSDSKNAYLLANYQNVQGNSTQKFQFDCPAILKYVYVALEEAEGGLIIKPTKVEQANVSFGKSTANGRGVVDASMEEGLFTKTEHREIKKEVYSHFLDIIPEGDTTNPDKESVHANFYYLSKGEFTIYPIYKVTAQSPVLGISYRVNGEWLQKDLVNSTDVTTYYMSYDGGETFGTQGGDFQEMLKNENFYHISVEGVKVNLPEGTPFYFYLTGLSHGTDYYSEVSLNDDGVSHFATFTNGYKIDGKDVMFIGAEDSPRPDDMDLNDFVCAFLGEKDDLPDIVDIPEETDKTMQYRVACEDLGDTDDFDFNDIVFGVNYASGEATATITLLAAGGTIPATITFDGTTITFGECTEVHAAFGETTDVMINTGGKSCSPVESDPFYVGDEFSIKNDIYKFKVLVDGRDEISVPQKTDDKSAVAPQAFVVADPTWVWPLERVSIISMYEDFLTWAQDYSAGNWYNAIWGTLTEPEEGGNTGGDNTSDYGVSLAEYLSDGAVIPASYFGDNEATLTIVVDGYAQFCAYVENPGWTSIVDQLYLTEKIKTIDLTKEKIDLIKAAGGLKVRYDGYTPSGLYVKTK